MSATLSQLANDAVLDVRPGDQDAAIQVERWLQDEARRIGIEAAILAGL